MNICLQYKGLKVDDAIALSKTNKHVCRIVREDVQRFVTDATYFMSRVNFEVDNGIVTEVRLG